MPKIISPMESLEARGEDTKEMARKMPLNHTDLEKNDWKCDILANLMGAREQS